MSLITAGQILQLAPRVEPARADQLATEIGISLPLYGAAGFLSRAHFLGQGAHESQGFTRLEENLDYSAARIAQVWPRLADRAVALAHNPQALANAAYARRLGNGGEESGDGWRFRGRGIFQLTGRANYAAASAAINADLVGKPELLLQIRFAVECAAWYWRTHGCIDAAARDDIEGVTRAIAGGLIGLADRQQLTDQAKRILDAARGRAWA